jgi:uncharacterized protein YlzI (FlbEa/FlbD family)
MSKKILEVSADATRQMNQVIDGSFYSAHEQEDIAKWLSHMDADTNDRSFEEVFGGDWYDDDCWDGLEDFNVKFQETDNADEGYCEFEDEIQKFIDEEPKRERDKGIRTVTYQLKDLIGNIDGIKDTTIQLFNDFKKVVKTDDVENLSEEEKKLYKTLNDMTQLTLKFPKPKVEKETYDPF